MEMWCKTFLTYICIPSIEEILFYKKSFICGVKRFFWGKFNALVDLYKNIY